MNFMMSQYTCTLPSLHSLHSDTAQSLLITQLCLSLGTTIALVPSMQALQARLSPLPLHLTSLVI